MGPKLKWKEKSRGFRRISDIREYLSRKFTSLPPILFYSSKIRLSHNGSREGITSECEALLLSHEHGVGLNLTCCQLRVCTFQSGVGDQSTAGIATNLCEHLQWRARSTRWKARTDPHWEGIIMPKRCRWNHQMRSRTPKQTYCHSG